MKNALDKRILRDLENQNPAISQVFEIFRLRAYSALVTGMPSTSMRLHAARGEVRWEREIKFKIKVFGECLTAILITAGLLGITATIYPNILTFIIKYWKDILLYISTISFSAGLILLINLGVSSPLKHIRAPNAETEEPLQELKALAKRTTARLHTTYRLQRYFVVAVGLILVTMIALTVVMVIMERIEYASAFGSGSMVILILTKLKWQPFEKINQARIHANQADVLLTSLNLALRTIQEIEDPKQKVKAQWQAVSEYLFLSHEGPGGPPPQPPLSLPKPPSSLPKAK